MAEQLKELIEKIQQEGIKVAEDRARSIEEDARRRAEAMINEAQKEAQTILLNAKDKSARMEESVKASLKQVGRDVILALKTEINAVLHKLIEARVREALTPQELAHILAVLVKESAVHEKTGVVISLKKSDAEKLEKEFLADLGKQVSGGITLNARQDIHGGFTISFDKEKSLFDFTDKAIADYITLMLKPKLAEILGGK